MDHTAIIDRLEADIREYRVEFQRFFNGESHTPPEERGVRIRRRLNTLVGTPQLSAVDRFRLGGLESRYNSLVELFRRRMRTMDQAQRPLSSSGTTAPPVVEMGSESSIGQVQGLYDAIYAQRQKKIALEDFHTYLAKQAAKVRERTGCEKVRFTVRTEAGKPKLKARPMRDAGQK